MQSDVEIEDLNCKASTPTLSEFKCNFDVSSLDCCVRSYPHLSPYVQDICKVCHRCLNYSKQHQLFPCCIRVSSCLPMYNTFFLLRKVTLDISKAP